LKGSTKHYIALQYHWSGVTGRIAGITYSYIKYLSIKKKKPIIDSLIENREIAFYPSINWKT